MVFIQDLFTSRNNKADPNTYKGQKDRLWYDSVTNSIRISDGITPGGIIVSGGGASSYGNANVAAYLPYDPTILAVNTSIVTANVGMKAYVDAQVISAGGYNDAAVAAFLPSYTGNIANSSDIIALYANAAAQNQSLLAVNNAIVVANTAVVSYVNSLNLAMLANVDAANAAIVTANSAVVSYVNSLNLAMLANVDAANAAIVTANTAMKSYVDYQISQGGGSYGNTQVAAYLPTYTGSLANSSDIIALNLLKANISSPTFTGNTVFNSNTAISLPVGNSLQRPIGTAGQIRYNTDTDVFEGYSTGWYEISSNVQLSANLQGGSNNQILVKKSSSDYDYAWEDMIINLPENTYTKLLDQASTTVLYLGEAAPNSLEASAVWRIQKILFDATGNVEEVRFAAGGSFNQIWNNRTSLVYV